MLSPITDTLTRIFVILILFVTLGMAVTYSRDQLLSLRNSSALLNLGQCSTISQLGLRRRGCRAGAHFHRRLLAARRVTSSTTCTSTCGEIPTIIGQRPTFINKHQLFHGRCEAGGVRLLPTFTTPDRRICERLLSPPLVIRTTEQDPMNQWLLQPPATPLHRVPAAEDTTSSARRTLSGPVTCNHVSISTNRLEEPHTGLQPPGTRSDNPIPLSMSTYTHSHSKSYAGQTRTTPASAAQHQPTQLSSPSTPTDQLANSTSDTLNCYSDSTPLLDYKLFSQQYHSDNHIDHPIADLDNSTLSPISPVSISSLPSVPSSLATSGDALSFLNNSYDSNINSISCSRNNYAWIHPTPHVLRFRFPTLFMANLRGGLCTKLDELSVLLCNNCVDIAILTETWLNDGITDDLVHITGYYLYRRDRQDGRIGGGVAVYVKYGTPCVFQSYHNQPSLEVMWFLFRQNLMPREVPYLLIGAVYHPPKANNVEMTNYLLKVLDAVSQDHPNLGILLLGDFNQLPEYQLKSYPLNQLVTNPTRGTATLDKIFANVKLWYQSPTILPAVGSSDHYAVLLQHTSTPNRPQRCKRTTCTRSSDPNGKAMLCYHLTHFNWLPLYSMDNCQTMVEYFYSVIMSLLDYYLPFVRRYSFNCDKPWVTSEFRNLIKRRQRAFLSGQFSLYRKLRNQTKRMAISLRKKYFEKKIQSLHSLDPHSWWTKVKHFIHSPNPNPLRSLHNSHPDVSIAELINDFFVGISAGLPPMDPDVISQLSPDYTYDFIIDPSEVDNRLSRIKIHKAPGPDGIPNWLLRDFSPLLCQPLSAIFNASLREGFFPPIWKSAEVIPIPKVNPPTSIQDDLRPISLLPTVGKVLEGIVKDWLIPSLDPLLDGNQFGCRRGRSTTHALIAIQHKWMEILDDRGSVRALFVDFRKAFDIINHNVLFSKLSNFNIPHCLLKWFVSYLSLRCQRVRVGHQVSSWKTLCGSMPQGSRLGPLSFIVMIDDLRAPCEVHKFVDDTTLSELIPPSHTRTDMANYLTSLLTWTAENDMQLNTSKTKEMLLGRLNPVNGKMSSQRSSE